MKKFTNPYLLRIYSDESDKMGTVTYHEVVVEMARREKMSGVTVMRGVMGFGASAHVHSSKFLILAQDLPIVLEIVDEKEKIDHFISLLPAVLKKGMATVQKVEEAVHFSP